MSPPINLGDPVLVFPGQVEVAGQVDQVGFVDAVLELLCKVLVGCLQLQPEKTQPIFHRVIDVLQQQLLQGQGYPLAAGPEFRLYPDALGACTVDGHADPGGALR
ncbi:hypothetical protein D3C79_1017550 [compost metagenome]